MAKKMSTGSAGDSPVTVFIPKQNRNDTQRFVSVNGERILVQTGVSVQIPAKFAEVLKNSEDMQQAAERYIEANSAM